MRKLRTTDTETRGNEGKGGEGRRQEARKQHSKGKGGGHHTHPKGPQHRPDLTNKAPMYD